MRRSHGINVVGVLFALFVISNAWSATITFAPLSGSNGSTYSGHTEAGFNISPVDSWQEAHIFGDPTPSIFYYAMGQNGPTGAIEVTDNSTGFFTFQQVDIGFAAGGTIDWIIEGYLSNAAVFSIQGSNTAVQGSWNTLMGTVNSLTIDSLRITMTTANVNSFNIDNIVVVSAVPLPAAGWLFVSGIGLLGWLRSKQRIAP